MTNFDQPFKDYEILDRVGAGAMGTVFKARQKRLNRIVALKILKPSLARDKRYVERLRREARIVASLSHPNIVAGYDLGEEGGYHFFVMEFVEGKSLRQLLVEWGMFAEEYVLRVAREVAQALDHAYTRDVIHRDIKPGNILIDESGRVKLTDMGLAKGPADLTLTRDGATVGTPMYISPEQARNPQDVDVRGDLYSLGATLYHMATGVAPFSGDTMAELITNVLNEEAPPPDEANSAVSPGLSLVIRKLLAKNLAVRYQTPRELLDDLDRIDRQQPPAVDPARLAASKDAASRWLRPLLFAAAAVMIALGAWWAGRQMVEPSPRAIGVERFLASLDRELDALPSAGARSLRLREISEAPSGALRPLQARRQAVAAELQAALDRAVAGFDGPGRDRLVRWLRDPRVWPGRPQFEREELLPSIRAACGVELAQLSSSVRRARVDALRQAVAEQLEERDAELLARFEQYVGRVVPGRADASARAGNFAEATGYWRVALTTFCDGVRQPLPEALEQAQRRALEARLAAARAPAVDGLQRAARAVSRALLDQVAAVRADLQQRLGRGVDPALVREAVDRQRRDLAHFWPPSSSFVVGDDPWPAAEQQLMAVESAADAASAERAAGRFERRCDTAWAAFCRGDAAAARAVLAGVEPATAAQERELQGHLRCLRAALDVEQAILRTVAGRSPAPVAYLAGRVEPFVLRVEPRGEALRLLGAPVDEPARELRLTELRIGALLDALGPQLPALRDLGAGPRALGLVSYRLAAGDAGDLARHVEALAEADRAFVLDRVAPRLERARGAPRREAPVDLASLFEMLEASLRNVEQGGSPRELTRALLRLEGRAPDELSSAQARVLREARARRDLALRRANVLSDLRAAAPRAARAVVEVRSGALVASVTMPADALRGGAGEGWERRDDVVEFAGGPRPFSEQPQLALRGDPGLQAAARRTRLELECTFPRSAVGDRSYLVAFDGVSFILVLAANDSVQVEMIAGDPLDEPRARRAFVKALAGAFGPARATAIPGALHRLTVDVVQVAPNQANVKVAFEGKELVRQLVGFDPKAPATFALHPRQELAVREVTARAFGL